MTVEYSRTNPFLSETYGQIATKYIDDSAQTLRNANRFQNDVNVQTVKNERISGPGVSGYTDETTVINDMKVENLDKAKIIFTQNYDHDGERVELPATGAAMMYYFAQYSYDIKSYTYRYPDEYEVYVKEGDGGETSPPTPTDPPPSTPGCTPPAAGTSRTGRVMDPMASAVIKADSRGNERFDVLLGIPTSESLYGNVFARSYLYQNEFVNMTGKCTFDIEVKKTWTLKWDPGKQVRGPNGQPITVPDPQTAQEIVKKTYKIERPYSYWTISNLEVYEIRQSELSNYALPGGRITLQPQGYSGPAYEASQNGGIYPPDVPAIVTAPPGVKDGGKTKPRPPDENLKSLAEKEVKKIKVSNDSLSFNGQTVMDGSRVEETGPSPGSIPNPSNISRDVLYSPNHIISSDKINRRNANSSGSILFGVMPGSINGGSDQTFPISGINPVTVHTPVVNYSSVTDDRAHNQKSNPTPGRSAFILERPFKVRTPTSGQHDNYPGYGDRDYAKYVRDKQVYFPFDVYSRDRSAFYPKNTWISIPVNQTDTEFFLPVWVDEGNYSVYFRTIAENAPTGYSTQPGANLDLSHHAATDIEQVEVIGRVYDFRVTDVADYKWETVFRLNKGSSAPRGTSYWVGLGDIDGGPRGNTQPFILPVAPGKHPQPPYHQTAVKTGYHFKFDLKTKGNMFGAKDGVSVTPSFYYVKKDGTGRQPVDLYYHSGNRHFIRIGSREDTEKRFVILNERLRNVPQSELMDTAAVLFRQGVGPHGMSADEYTRKYANSLSKKRIWVGRYDWLLLPPGVRTFIGPKSGLPGGIDSLRSNAAIQKWYGEYSIPSDVYVVPKGTNLAAYARGKRLDEKSDVFLKNGYVIVNFNIETVRNGNIAEPHLQYIHAPLMNQWKLEGFQGTHRTPSGIIFSLIDGDVVFYHADQSSREDFRSEVTH